LSLIRRSAAGVRETSYYGTLETLFNEVGSKLKPKVRCVINLANKGAGIPDGGLFTPDQFQKKSNDLIEGQLPARGAIEIKGTAEDVDAIKDSEQVAKYLAKYGQVLVTNYRDFLLVTRDENGRAKPLERYSLAENESAFWSMADRPNAAADADNERFVEYLWRVMRSNAPISKPEDVAWFLASYARDARARVEMADVSALETIRSALEGSLGVKFEGEKGEHFFRSTLVQTLFYGIFSAWVLWHKRSKSSPPYEGGVDAPAVSGGGRGGSLDRRNKFNWRTAVWELKVPMISVLFAQIAQPATVRQLNLEEVLDWTESVLNRVVREEFFARFAEEHAVQYFYEPFLQAFDPELRKELGVWYTPEEIVRYMVERVDRVLRTELNLPDGLADDSVYVLDPACGTGAYLVEVLRRINRTLEEKGGGDTRGIKLKNAVMKRVFGFEILPAPFVVSHLQIGLLLEQLGVGFSDDKKERAGVYLTNSLTGWDEKPKKHLPYPEFEQERDLADEVKLSKPIIVILGNPPYNGFAGLAVEEERELSNTYRTTKNAPTPQGQGLNDLYVRFFRLAERRIAEISKKGVICFISNYSWLEGLSHTGMRERYLEVFNKIWIDNLHGDRIISEVAPDGKSSTTIFAVQGSSVGIKVGTSISLLVVNGRDQHDVLYRDFNESNSQVRRDALLESLKEDAYESLTPNVKLGYPFKPFEVNDYYFNWPLLNQLFPVSFPGVKTSRDEELTSLDRQSLVLRMQKYFDESVSHDEMRRIAPKLMTDTARFKAIETREFLLKRGIKSEQLIRYSYRPFDLRWLYWEGETKLLDEKRPEYFTQVFDGNFSIVTQQMARRDWSRPQFITRMGCLDLMDRGAGCFPLYLVKSKPGLFDETGAIVPNLSQFATKYLVRVSSSETNLFFHSLAIMHSPDYRCDHASALRQNFPRIPLPAKREDLIASAQLGRRVAALLDTERAVDGVTAGNILPELRTLGVVRHIEGKQLTEDDFKVTAGWGHAGKGGVTMPGKGRIEERTTQSVQGDGHPSFPKEGSLLDVYLNNDAYWSNVPERVWNYYIGGYQVIKKWLSYREFDLLGRGLKLEEVEEVTNMVRRIAGLVLMEDELNANYQRIRANTYAFPRSS